MILSNQWIFKFYDENKASNFAFGVIVFQIITTLSSFVFYLDFLKGKPFNVQWLYEYTTYFHYYWPYLIASYILGDICMYKAGEGYKNKNYDAVRFYGLLSALFGTAGILFAAYVPILALELCFGIYSIILAISRKFIKWLNTEPKPKPKKDSSNKDTIKCYDDLLQNKKRYY